MKFTAMRVIEHAQFADWTEDEDAFSGFHISTARGGRVRLDELIPSGALPPEGRIYGPRGTFTVKIEFEPES